jgi:cytochrome c oxidase assembly protein subunit 15
MNQSTNKAVNSFRRTSTWTVIAVYFLILVGGIVRSTGSGMGCPDWPRCFGSVIPPTHQDQLPANYQEVYLEKRLAKNERFVATLEKLGFDEKAAEIANDKSILVEEEFNATKTWIEYINRLVGVFIGLLIMLTVWKSFKLWKLNRQIAIYSVIALILVLFTGWIGSIVVSTNLLAWMITFHMLLALALVAVLLYVNHLSERLQPEHGMKVDVPAKVQWVLVIGAFLTLIQVILGTQVREEIDQISFALGDLLREEWISRLGIDFLIHRSFSIVLLLVHLLYFYWAFRYSARRSKVNLLSQILMLVLLLEIASGMGMAYFGIPAFLQPVHLLLGSLILGIQFTLILQLKDHVQFKLNTI